MRTAALKFSLTATALIVLASVSARADPVVIDPAGDFLPTYVGPPNGDLDVISTSVTLAGSNFVFSATLNAPIGTTAQAFYIWGVDRGSGAMTANFASLGLPNIVFDSVIRINPDGTGSVTLLAPGPPVVTNLPAGSVTINVSSFQAVVPVSFLPSRGFAPGEYGQNLWPRWGGVPFGDPQISDFAPDDRNAGVTTAPEPATVLLLGAGLVGVAGAARRSRKAQEAASE